MAKNKMKTIAAAIFSAALILVSFQGAKAAVSTNAAATVAIGQANLTNNSANQGGTVAINSLNGSRGVFFDGNHFFVADRSNNRVLIYNSIPTTSDASADVVVGQADMTSNLANRGGSPAANTLFQPVAVYSDGEKLFIADSFNNRVLIFNSIPTSNNTSADVVVGQVDMASNGQNRGGAVGANTLYEPYGIFSSGAKLFISDSQNNRILIFNSIPTTSDASANIVIGQQNLSVNTANQGAAVGANTLDLPYGVFFNGAKFFVADSQNNRVLIFNSIPTENNASANVAVGQSNLTSNTANQGSSPAANTMYYPVFAYSYGSRLIVSDRYNNRVLVFNSIPTSNNAGAEVVIGQADMTSNLENQGGVSANATTLYGPRCVMVGNTKLFVSDGDNNRVLIYSFGSQWTINKNKSKTFSGGEKMKVKKNKLEFSGKKTSLKKGKVKVYRNGDYVKKVKIKNSGKWKLSFKDTGSSVKYFVLKYYNSANQLQFNSETYAIGINRGSLSEATLTKAEYLGSAENFQKEAIKASGNIEQDTGYSED